MEPRPWHAAYDNGVPTELTVEPVTLVDYLARAVSAHPDRPALIYLNRTLTYRELDDQVRRAAAVFTGFGLTPGSRIGIMMPNLPQFVIAYYGALVAGLVPAPTNPLYTAREIEHQWNDAGCEAAVLTDYVYAQRVRDIRHRLPVRHYLIAPIAEYLGFPLRVLAPLKLRRAEPPLAARVPADTHVHRFAALLARTTPMPHSARSSLDAVATLLYTGGTTGVSKGAMLTHQNLTANVQQLAAWFPGLTEGREVMLCALPLFHSFGLTVAMNLGIRLAAALVMIPNPRDIPAIVRATARHRITLFPAVPNHYNAINQYLAEHAVDLTSIKVCNSGSAPLPVEVLETFERITGSKISEGYGLTETSPVTHSNPVGGRRKVGSIGVPLPGTDARVVDIEEGTRTLAPNAVGELVVRGPQIMKGYWQRPEATADMIRDGWLYTGDLARIDEDGFCFIEGRKKDMILCSGFNVYPDEIDRVLAGHPAVLEAATIGIPDAKRGETVKSFVVLRPGATATAEAITTYCREYLAPYKVPRVVEFRDALPKSSVLKILRRQLREEELAKRQP